MLSLGVLTLNILSSLLLPLSRISAFMMIAPIFNQGANALRIRTLYALLLSAAVLPGFFSNTSNFYNYHQISFADVFGEALIGFSMGLILQFVVAAVVTAGEQISTAVGIGFSQTFDPNIGPTPVIGRLLNIIALLVFLAAQGHSVVISIILNSFQKFPPGNFPPLDYQFLISYSSIIFSGAALLSVPILLALLSVNISMGVLSKATPALNIFAIGFAANLIVGFGLLFISVPSIVDRLADLWSGALQFQKTIYNQ